MLSHLQALQLKDPQLHPITTTTITLIIHTTTTILKVPMELILWQQTTPMLKGMSMQFPLNLHRRRQQYRQSIKIKRKK